MTTARLGHCRPVAGPHGAVASAHPAATTTASDLLAAGGSAVDAAIAAQAVVCVAMPHAAGLGGDLMALVREPSGAVVAVNGNGRSPARATPATLGADGGASVTVPGLVDAWVQAHARWGRLPLSRVLAPATELAAAGVPVGVDLAVAVTAQRTRLLRGGADGWPLLALPPGARWVQPELAALLHAVGEHGRDAFYAGEVAEAVAAAARRHGGALRVADLGGHRTPVGDPVTVGWAGGRLYVQPPTSQGILLAMAARWLDRVAPTLTTAPLDHVLVEVTEAAFAHRDACGRGTALFDLGLDVDRVRAGRRGGPRASLHTAGVAVADRTGQVVSSLVSVFDAFGSGVFVPEAGIVLNNRAGGFTAGDNAPAAGARPVHTLAPALLTDDSGGVVAVATPGADGQVQTLLQLLARQRFRGANLAAAVAASRWRSQDGGLLVEADHPALGELADRGHAVEVRPPGDEVFGAVVVAGTGPTGPYAAADWRQAVSAAAQ